MIVSKRQEKDGSSALSPAGKKAGDVIYGVTAPVKTPLVGPVQRP